ncbi:MAG: alpha-L-fucosidase [Acidobacteriota bacterium]
MVHLDRRQLLIAGGSLLGASLACANGQRKSPMLFEPNRESLQTHAVPAWFKHAKYGIFIHWGPYSVPAFAPAPEALAGASPDPANGFRFNPYAEWYLNTMQFEDSPTAEFHRATYGDASYDDFGGAFNESLQGWNPDEWARVFQRSGARYVVLVTKHHDGFLLWPSATPNPHKPNWGTTRDVVGELAEAVRAQGLRFGTYYSGGIDWTFKHRRIGGLADLFANVPTSENYPAYANAHYAELIERYRPDYLWNDIGYPSDVDAFGVLADYYNAVPEGLTNDRWMTPDGVAHLEASAQPEGVDGMIPPEPPVWDVRTPEYSQIRQLLPFDWESTRGLGRSFGFNRNEGEDDLLAADEIVTMLVGSAAFGGNVLLNTGPRGDAQLDPLQVERLLEVGAWLESRGRTFQDTRAISLPERTAGEIAVGAVENDDELIVHLLGTPQDSRVEVELPPVNVEEASLLGGENADAAVQEGRLVLAPERWPDSPIQTVVLRKST